METQVICRHDCAFVETENKETENKDNMKESETDYKALYEETISKLKIAKESVGCYTFSEVIDKVIPEVAENDDERTRNEIIAFVETSIHRGGGTPIPEEQENKWLAWLEKQKTTEEALRYLKENHSPSEVSDFQAAMNIAVAKAYNKGYTDGLEKQGGQKPADKVESISKDDEDESIIKDIIAYMRYERKSTEEEIENRFIPWLEKQGERKEIDYNEELKKCRANPLYFFDKYVKVKLNEQKPADKVEPKFNVGDSIKTANEEPLTITEITDNGYWSEDLFICNFDDAKWELVEKKPADKFEPKFNVGDWLVCCNYEPEQIIGIKNDMYEMSNGDIRPIKMVNNNHNIRLWTIQDAKDGDVLAWYDSKCIALFKEISDNDTFKSYGFVGACTGMFENGAFHDIEDAHPATREQRDLLFTKMKEAGYEWDVKKKELREIEQKSDWSEEDESILQNILVCLKNGWRKVPTDILKYESWLKALKERVQSQPKKELNEDAANEYVDLGLSSGTLWKSVNEEGYYTFDEAVEKFGHNLPTKEQWDELKDNCDWVWKGAGYEVTGPNGNVIFLPATGYRYGAVVYDLGTDGNYWSCIQHDDADHVYYLCFDGRNIHMDYSYRNYGQSIRLVNR